MHKSNQPVQLRPAGYVNFAQQWLDRFNSGVMGHWFAREQLMRVIQLEGIDPAAALLERMVEFNQHSEAREAIADVIQAHCEAEILINGASGTRIKTSFL